MGKFKLVPRAPHWQKMALSVCTCACISAYVLCLFAYVSCSVSLSVSLSRRVPYQDVIVGLMSNQLLIQCVCALLLRGTRNTVAAEQGILTDSAAATARDSATTAAAAAAADDDDDNDDDCQADDSTNLLTSTPPLPGLYLCITKQCLIFFVLLIPLYLLKVCVCLQFLCQTCCSAWLYIFICFCF